MLFPTRDRSVQNFRIILPALIPIIFIATVHATESTINVPIDPIEDNISVQDVQDVFSYIGIDIHKFRYIIPEANCIQWGSITYLDGKEQTPTYSGKSCSPGNQLTTLTMISHRDGDSLKFSVRLRTDQGSSGISLPMVEVKGGGTWGHLANQRLEVGHQTPLFVFAQDVRGVSGINPNDSLKDIIATYHRVVVAFAKLENAERE